MKILLILQSSKPNGISYYRQLMPHALLKTLNKDVELEQILGATYKNIEQVPDEKLKEFQIVVLSREIDAMGTGLQTINRLRSLGLKIVLDVDDYWMLPSGHKLSGIYDTYKIPQLIIDNIVAADHVITTNTKLASYILDHNKEVTVLPNCVDTNQPQFNNEPTATNKVRFGWIGGVYHTKDAEPMARSFEKLWKDKTVNRLWSMSFGGYTINSDRDKMESIFTAGYKFMSYDYRNFLSKKINEGYDDTNETYKRMWALDAFNYIKMYNNIDVSLIPLRDNLFNNCKSELKVIEAGAMGKAAIVNNCYPYNEICNSKNSILIGYDKPHRDWYEAMKLLINNPQMRIDLASQLTIDCDNKFNAERITKQRYDLYKWLIR